MNYLLDTNTILYILKGKSKSLPFLKNDISISFITKIELLSFNANPPESESINKILNNYEIIYIDNELIAKVIMIRKETGLKISDSIIVATSLQQSSILVTSDLHVIKKASKVGVSTFDTLTGKETK